VKSLLSHFPCPVSLRKFAFEQGYLADEVPGIPSDRRWHNDIFSLTQDDPACDTDASTPLRGNPCEKQR
jgi:hypothetical protein